MTFLEYATMLASRPEFVLGVFWFLFAIVMSHKVIR